MNASSTFVSTVFSTGEPAPRERGAAWASCAMAAGVAALLSACAVGPDYPGAPAVATPAFEQPAFARAPLAPVDPVPPPARWWDAVGEPMLTRLVDDAFAASPTLAEALARVRSARALVATNKAALGPTGGTSGRYIRGRIPTSSLGLGSGGGASGGSGGGASIPDPIKLDTYTGDVDATWELDLFGGKRRDVESAKAGVQARQAAFEDAQVRLASDVGQAYAQLREAQGRLALALGGIDLRERSLALTVQRRALGTAAQGDVEQAGSDLAQARAEVPGLQTQIEQQLDALAILAGREPGAYDAVLTLPATERVVPPLPPERVAVDAPADWLRRRPDIRQAERTLASRNATIGKNVAALFPSVSLFGYLGTSGADIGDLFKGPVAWLLTPSLTWNFLSIPSNRAKVRGAEADRDESLADYRRVVLEALQDANDSLSRFGRQRQALASRSQAREAAARAERLVERRYAGGTASLIDLLDAQRQRLQVEDDWVQARADLMVDYVTLQKSLGLGWSSEPTRMASGASAGTAVQAAP